jgi:hypothetical protein
MIKEEYEQVYVCKYNQKDTDGCKCNGNPMDVKQRALR